MGTCRFVCAVAALLAWRFCRKRPAITETYPLLTLVPPLLAITLVVATKRVLISLGVGVLSAALLVADFNPLQTVAELWAAFSFIFWDDGGVNTWYVYILIFTMLLGVIAAFIMMSGGTQAFATWALQRIKTRRGAQLLPAILGLVIFIDDYFNALAVGQISRSVTDKHRISRAKLAYLVDSTSAPIAVLAPFSSWGAYIMGILAPLVAASALTISNLEAFVRAALTNYYAIAAVLIVWVALVMRLDIGPMRREERRAIVEGDLFEEGIQIPGELSEDLPVHEPGARRALVVPFGLLVLGVFAGIIITGYQAAGQWDVIAILDATDVSAALLWGGLLGLAATLYYYFRHTRKNPKFAWRSFGKGWLAGSRSMLPAVTILILAWTLGELIAALGTGDFLGDLVQAANLPAVWLVPAMFVCAGAMAFATGTSWGSFGILLPLAGAIMNAIGEPELLLPAFGAVLAGAVFGDHASPISDTSILSATGAGSNVIVHVLTQLPYALAGAGAALLGYLALALSGSGIVGLITTVAGVAALAVVARARATPLEVEAAGARETTN